MSRVDYLSRDFDSLVDDLISLIPTYLPEWESVDQSYSDFGRAMIESFAYLTDGTNYYIEHLLNNSYTDSATDRSALIKLAKHLGYDVGTPVSATGVVRFSITTPHDKKITIQEDDQVSTEESDATVFEIQKDGDGSLPEIEIGQTSVEANIKQGETTTQNLLASDGSANQYRIVSHTDIASGTLSVFVKEGASYEEWTKEDTLLFSGASDKDYYVRINSDNKYVIYFGDNENGKIPSITSEIKAVYMRGGGVIGIVGIGTITRIISTIYDSDSIEVSNISVTNESKATGGSNQETFQYIKEYIPYSFKAIERAVSLEDYRTLALGYFGIAKARAKRNITEFGTINIYIAPNGGGLPSSLLKANIGTWFQSRKPLTTAIRIKDPVYVDVNINMLLQVGDSYKRATVQNAVDTAVSSLLVFDDVDFGTYIELSNIYDTIVRVEGVSWVIIEQCSTKPSIILDANNNADDYSISNYTITNDTLKKKLHIAILSDTDTYGVEEREVGVSTGLTDTILTDITKSWTTNELVGKKLNPNDGQIVEKTIISNTSTTITVASGLDSIAHIGDNFFISEDKSNGTFDVEYTMSDGFKITLTSGGIRYESDNMEINIHPLIGNIEPELLEIPQEGTITINAQGGLVS